MKRSSLMGIRFLILFFTLGGLLGRDLLMNDRKSDKRGDPAVYIKTEKVGISGRALLSDSLFQSVLIEMQYMPGFAPSQEAMNLFQSFLEKHLTKHKIAYIPPAQIPSMGKTSYSVSDIRKIEANHRREKTLKNRVALYLLFVDKPSSDDQADGDRMLGQAYQNTSIVIYASTIKDLLEQANPKPSMGLLEATVMAHEFGHTLGLVNDGLSATDPEHEDPKHPHHCNNSSCLMNSSAQSVSVLSNLTSGSIPQFDSACLEAIKAAGGK